MRRVIACLVLAPLLAGCVGNEDVVPLIGWAAEDGSIRVLPGETVTFWLGKTVTSAEGAPELDIAWAFGDGTNATGNPVEHAYAGEGRFRVVADWDGRVMEHSLAVDFEKVIAANAPANPPVATEDPRYDVHPFEAFTGARAIDIALETDLGPRETLHLRLVGPDGQEVLRDSTATGTIHVSTETASIGSHEVQIWVRDTLQGKPVTGTIAVAY